MAEQEKLTFAQAWQLLKEAANKGTEQGNDLVASGNALRVVVAYRIKQERTALGITQEQMCERINTNILTYRGYESCKSNIPLILLVRIANELNLSLDYLTGRIEKAETLSLESLDERLRNLEEHLKK